MKKELSAKFVALRGLAYSFRMVLVIVAVVAVVLCMMGAFVFGVPAMVLAALGFVFRMMGKACAWASVKLDFASTKAERGVSLAAAGTVSAASGHGVVIPTGDADPDENIPCVVFGDRDLEAPSLWMYPTSVPPKEEEEVVETPFEGPLETEEAPA